MTTDPHPTHWAVLIGVGVYIDKIERDCTGPGPVPDRSSEGAVRDVAVLKDLLVKEPKKLDIVTFTATRSTQEAVGEAIEAPERLPTWDNVVASLKRIITLAKPGHHAYLHFSGHGVMRPSEGVALALYDPKWGTSYMYGEVLRNALAKMVSQGIRVTLVLDCCFSGSVLRVPEEHGITIRCLDYDPLIDKHSNRGDPFIGAADGNLRGSQLKLGRLLDPNEYAILAACGPNENALEVTLPGGSRMGVLSYFLTECLGMLQKARSSITHQLLHQRLCSRINAYCFHQTPMLYGSPGVSFFEDTLMRPLDDLVSAFRELKNEKLILDAGLAHGVHVDDEYALYAFPPFNGPSSSRTEDFLKASIKSVHNLASEMVLREPSQMVRVKRGSTWTARLTTSTSTGRIRTTLAKEVSDRKTLTEMATQHPFLSLGLEEMETSTPAYRVTVNSASHFEICDAASEAIPYLPTIELGSSNSQKTLIKVLGHLSTFKYFEQIENRNLDPTFEQSFSISVNAPLTPDGHYEVNNEDVLTVQLENSTPETRYLSIYEFDPLYSILNMFSESGEGTFSFLPPRSTVQFPMKMTITALSTGETPAKEEVMYKMFVTSKPTNFPSMVLHSIDREVLRGETSQLAEFLRMLETSFPVMRDNKAEGWSTRSLFVRIVTKRKR